LKPVWLEPERDLSEALRGARWVAGCQSFALVIALASGRDVVSTLPPWAPECALPHKGLIRLKDRVEREKP